VTKPSFTPSLRWVSDAAGQMTSEAQRILRSLLDIAYNRTGLEASKVVTGTAGAANELAKWNADGDLVTVGNAAAARALIGSVIGTDVQAYDADLAAIAALSTTSLGRAILTLTGSAKRRIQVDGAGTGIEAVADWEPIEIGSVLSSVASWSRTGLSAYEALYVEGFLIPVTSGAGGILHSSTDNGANWDSGAGDYYREFSYATGGSITAGQGNISAVALGSPHNDAGYGGTTFSMTARNFNKSRRADFVGIYSYVESTGTPSIVNYFTQRGSNTARDAIRISFSTGNIASGRISLWGLRG
jgi:hypothetical protein